MTTITVPERLYGPLAPQAESRVQVTGSFGVSGEPDGLTPFDIHDHLLRRESAVTRGAAAAQAFRINDQTFWWVIPIAGEELSRAVGLAGHRVTHPDARMREALAEALRLLARTPWAFAMVRTYLTSFAVVELTDAGSGSRLVTSCSLPDIPLCAFLSGAALRHVPPLSVSPKDSVHLLAENIYHEAVHQYVNHQIITDGIFVESFDSRTSPLVEISWRRTPDGSAQQWQVDRVFHAASVYGHLTAWRLHELRQGHLDRTTSRTVEQASHASLAALTELLTALQKHIGVFTPKGALRIGQLIGSAQFYQEALRLVLSPDPQSSRLAQ